MITKEGVITETVGTRAWVTTTRSRACDSCASRNSCGENSREQEMIIQLENSLNASPGDRVVVGFRTAPLLKTTFLIYIFPIILLIAGAATGESMAIQFNTDKSLTSLFVGILFFSVSFFIIRFINNALANKKEYQPYLMRIIKKKPCTLPSEHIIH